MSLYFFMLKKTPLVVKTNRLPKGGVINSFEWGAKIMILLQNYNIFLLK